MTEKTVKTQGDDINEDFPYEVTRKKLAEIVATLEEGNDDLDKSLKLFEEGAKLAKECKEYLENAKKKLVKE